MKKSGGTQFTSTYIMYGLVVVALILLTVFIVRGSMTERFFAATTSDPIQTKFTKITTESDKLGNMKNAHFELCTTELEPLLTETREEIQQYILDRKKQHDEYAAKFNELSRNIRAKCNKSYSMNIQDISPQIPPPTTPAGSGGGSSSAGAGATSST